MKLLLSCSLFFFSTLLFAEVNPDMILKKADEIRNPSESFQMKVTVHSSTEAEDSEFDVMIKGKNKTLVKTLLPRRDRGRNMLMLDESMWVFIPNLKREVRISLAQKLTGQAANGDISRMRWHGDYTSKIIKENEKLYALSLTANKKGLTYEKIILWVNKKTYQPVTASYLSLTGKKLKEASFKGYKEIAGGMRPTQIFIQDSVNEKENSLITITEMTSKDFPDSYFIRENLK